MAIKKLSDGPVEMLVSDARIVEGQYGSQVQFVGQEAGASEDTVLYISERSAVRQLERLAISVDGCAGETLRFEQVSRDGRTYNNIYRSTNAAPAPDPSNVAKGASPAPAPSNVASRAGIGQLEAIGELYGECLSLAVRHAMALEEEFGFTLTSSDVVAATATIFIQANRR